MILSHKPVHSSLSFLLTLLTLAALYLQLSAQFIAVMQVLVYAGAILVLFMFVIVLFRMPISNCVDFKAQSSALALGFGGVILSADFDILGLHLIGFHAPVKKRCRRIWYRPRRWAGLYISIFFFLLKPSFCFFLIAGVGVLYIGKES